MMDQKYRVRVNREAPISGGRQMNAKKKWILWGSIAGGALIIIIILLIVIGGRGEDEPVADGVEVELAIEKGDVQIQEPGEDSFRDAVDGMTIDPGSELRTEGDTLAALELSTGSVARLNEDSRVSLDEATGEAFSLTLVDGEVWVLVAGDEPPATKVTTEEARVQAQSTVFDVARDSNVSTVFAVDDTSVVNSHELDSETDLATLFLQQGEQTEVDADSLPEDESDFETDDIPDDTLESFWFRWNQEKDAEHLDKLEGREDKDGPKLTISSPDDNEETDEETITVSGKTDISATVTVNGDDVDVDLGEFETDVDLEEGENTITIVATDAAGNETKKKITVTRKPSGPDAVSVTLSTTEPGSITVLWEESDIGDFGSYVVKRDEEVVARFTDQNTTEYVDEGLSPGTSYTYNVCVVDADGQEACSQDESATVEGEPNGEPSVDITSPGNGDSFSGGTAVGFSANGTDPDGDSLTYFWDFGDGVSTSGQDVTHAYSVSSSSQNFTVSVTVTDRAGATATSTISVTITP